MALLVGAGVQSVDTASAQFHAEDRALGSVIRVGCGSSSPAKVPPREYVQQDCKVRFIL
jgi:hypothetical protein